MSAETTPGYRDDHLHLLACAAARRSVDVQAATSVRELLDLIGHAAGGPLGSAPPQDRHDVAARDRGESRGWLRAWGYDDVLLAERRHPTIVELDAVTVGRPTVLHHITGHVAVANTAAGRALGLGAGEVLIERHDVLAGVPRPERAEIVSGVAAVLGDLAAAGIIACTDATHTNDLDALELLADAVAAAPAVSVTAMVGADRLDSLGGLRFGEVVLSPETAADEVCGASLVPPSGSSVLFAGATADDVGVRIGHAKVMPPHDDDSAIADLVAEARAHGFPVAIHAMDIDTLQAALDALEAHPPPPAEADASKPSAVEPAGPELDRTGPGRTESDRIEHCALALPEQLDRIARLGLTVVTQPSFVTRRAQKYREQLSPTEQAWLWPLASLLRRGIRVTLSSDAPTVPSDPAEWMEAAAFRDLAPAERIDPERARELCLYDR
ncbi:amidohydrolase family protein [Candidatus Poriferisodalis sp.]|uniref:amidohydrolase family protein n=1 Tax=Candidatus Poriferisodalis sp. TaxID=3101277 RepID=UPI003B51D338